jgi:hypothetical protein
VPEADKAAARADIPGPGCDEAAGPARGVTLLAYEPLVKGWLGVGIWRTGGEPACERIGDAANRAIEAALGALLGDARPLLGPGEVERGTGRGLVEDALSRGSDMVSWSV